MVGFVICTIMDRMSLKEQVMCVTSFLVLLFWLVSIWYSFLFVYVFFFARLGVSTVQGLASRENRVNIYIYNSPPR